jgi:hypothetical protein
MTRGPHRSTTEMISGLRTSEISNFKTHLPSKFADFCHVSPLMDGSDLLRDFDTLVLRDFDTLGLHFDALGLQHFGTLALRRFRTFQYLTSTILWSANSKRGICLHVSLWLGWFRIILGVQVSDLRELCALLTSNLPKPISVNPWIDCHLSPFNIYDSCSLRAPRLRTFSLALYFMQLQDSERLRATNLNFT